MTRASSATKRARSGTGDTSTRLASLERPPATGTSSTIVSAARAGTAAAVTSVVPQTTINARAAGFTSGDQSYQRGASGTRITDFQCASQPRTIYGPLLSTGR